VDYHPFPPRDEELARLRKEVKVLRKANKILKKVAVIFAVMAYQFMHAIRTNISFWR
jgi:transposase-like protein